MTKRWRFTPATWGLAEPVDGPRAGRTASIHPIIRTSVALRISRLTIGGIVALFLAVSVGLAATFLLVMDALQDGPEAALVQFSIPRLGEMLFNPTDFLSLPNRGLAFYAVALLASTARLLLPVFLLGAFVFKLFREDPLIWRAGISVEDADGILGTVLRVRFYNATAAPLVNVTIQVLARIRSTGTPRNVRNVQLDVARGQPPTLHREAVWSYSRPGVPFTVTAPLGRRISAGETADGKYVDIPGQVDLISKERVDFFILVSGTNMETGVSFYSVKEYPASSALRLGHYAEVNVVYDEDPRRWRGWPLFEENVGLYVFGYASLIGPSSVEATLGRPVDKSAFSYAELSGWVRTWSVGTDKTSHPERTFRLEDGSEFDGVTVVLGLDSRPNGSCDGAVFPVTQDDLTALDIRERNYKRVDVSDAVSWAGKPAQCVVYTYIPLGEARLRISRAKRDGQSINIRRGYLDLVLDVFAEAGYAGARPELENVPFPVEELGVDIDPNFDPARIGMQLSSYLQQGAAAQNPPSNP